MDEEVGALKSTGIFDAVFRSMISVTNCTSKGTDTCTFRDGSSYTNEWTADCRPNGWLIFEGRGLYVHGTGPRTS